MNYIGVDIGSTGAKTVVINEKKEVVLKFVQPTGWSSVETAETISEKLKESGFYPQLLPCVATGYGRIAVPFSNKNITEITCHAKGAMHIYNCDNLTVIDIGGQDTKIISVENGMVKDFVMNDKCSAGTGRFLEVMANTLALKPDELCTLAESGGGASISSMCTVFAESEVIGLIGRGEPKENIAFAVVDSIIKKVVSQVKRIDMPEGKVCLTGGLCQCDYISRALSEALKTEVEALPEGRYAGAVGAAVFASKL